MEETSNVISVSTALWPRELECGTPFQQSEPMLSPLSAMTESSREL